MNLYRITVSGAYAGQEDIEASTPDVAVKKLLGGGASQHYRFASVYTPRRVRLDVGQQISVHVIRMR